uniref:GRB10 interacting GYF protein 2 n=1 Tax=Hucho hucho TaxID=62062 RepID=A0A4W5RA08_9TELE
RMAETQTLNFGPEWLRALSGGGHGGGSSSSVAISPPLSPAMPKYKLADYRYGREEMLALYVKDREIPVDLHDKDFLPILQEEPLPPLALVAFTEEEQRNFSMSVNSAAVLRLMGRGGGPVGPGAPRGRSTSRGRGRGRGDGGFYQRSFDDVEGGFGRGGREMHRSQSWEERGDRRFEKPGRKEPGLCQYFYSILSSPVRANYEEVGTGVGGLPVRKHDFTRSESENWRTSRDEVNGEDDDEGGWRLAGASQRDSDRWCPPSPDGPRSAGWREAHPGEQPRQRRLPLDAREDERGYRHPPSGSGSLEEDGGGSLPEWCLEDAEEETGTFDSSGAFLSLKKAPKEPILEEAELDFRPLEECDEGLEEDRHPRETTDEEARREPDRKQGELRRGETVQHTVFLLPIEAEKMVAYLQDGDDRLAAKSSATKPAGLPLTHEAALKWFYKDPQGEIQGPFSNPEMTEWFQAGYFTMTLLVKRGCDEVFQPLGEIIKMWGRVPFAPGPAPPPLLGDAGDQERLKRQQELTALNLYQLQQLQYQYLLRQQYAQALAQQKAQALSSAPHQQQQQQQQQINLLLQQYQALKMRLEILTDCVLCAYTAWEGSSVWDLPIDSIAQAPTIEQMQNLEKKKAAKVRATFFLYLCNPKFQIFMKCPGLGLNVRNFTVFKHFKGLAFFYPQEEALKRQQKQQEEAQRQQKEEEEERQAQEEALRRLEERRREEEEERKQREEFLRKQEEERRKQEELEALRRHEEEKRQEEEAVVALVRQQQEEAKKREQEAARQQELARQRQQQQEALRRLQQQQQLAQMKVTNSITLRQHLKTLTTTTARALLMNPPSPPMQQRRQQVEHLKLLQQQALMEARNPQAKLSSWGSVAKQPATTKSLLEIQREEAQQVKQRKEQGGGGQQPSHPTVTHPSVWGSVATSGGAPNWGGDSSIWGDNTNSNMGFWDEAVKEVAQAPPPARKPNAQKNNKGNANLSSSRANKKVEEEEKLLKLFQGVNKRQQDGFMQWCEKTLHTLNTANNLDVPTFASFLKEVDSPYEVHDYVRAYLGDTSEAKEFAKQFLERRAKQNANQQKATPAPQNQQPTLKQQQQESTWGVSGTGSPSLYQSNHTSLQQQARFETVTSGKKKKKQKMVRADPSLLGFSVNAASERLNMGEIETVEDF